jgi:hypothetical protein
MKGERMIRGPFLLVYCIAKSPGFISLFPGFRSTVPTYLEDSKCSPLGGKKTLNKPVLHGWRFPSPQHFSNVF